MSELLPHPVTSTPYPSPVPPGTGWPDDPAQPGTPVARGPSAVRRLAATDDLGELDARVSVCSACPRLVRWREDVARDKRASFADQLAACRADIDAHLASCPVPVADAATVIGTSGTIKTLAAAMLDLPCYDREAIDGAVLGAAETSAYVDRLLAMTVAERRGIASLHPGRADVIGAGALIWSRVLAHAAVPTYLVSEGDILYGIASSLVAHE